MNLIDLFTRNAKILEKSGDFRVTQTNWNGSRWRTVDSSGEQDNRIIIKGYQNTYQFRTRSAELGWFICAINDTATVKIMLKSDQNILYESSLSLDKNPIPVRLNWPVGQDLSGCIDLNFEFIGEVKIFVHRALSREPLYSLAKGDGIEIGPGPNPQIAGSQNTSVKYLEELPQEDWVRNDAKGKYGAAEADWSHYLIGKASDLPVADNSLDFIFSSHVFEHLANPLGHLAHWHTKLKENGVVIAVVPDLAGCKDYSAQPSTLEELTREFQREIWSPEKSHYERFLNQRNMQQRLDEYISDKKPIHVHYYTQSNMPTILEHAVTQLGYRSYDFIYERNHKDFYFVLYAG